MTGPNGRTPNPVSQWLGLVTGAVDEARTLLGRIPAQMVRLPLVALSAALALRERLRREHGPRTPGGQSQRPNGPDVGQPGLADVRRLRPPAAASAPPAPPAAASAPPAQPAAVSTPTPQPTAAPAPPGPQAVAPPAPGAPPLADFDTMTVASLRGRLRVLDLPTLTRLRDWEAARAARPAILAMLDHRIDKLSGIA